MTKVKIQNVTKLKNSNCDKSQKLRLWQYSKTQIVTNLTNSKCYKTQNSNCYKTIKKKKLWQNSKTKILTKLKNSNCNKTKKLKLWPTQKINFWQNSKTQRAWLHRETMDFFLVKTMLLKKFWSFFLANISYFEWYWRINNQVFIFLPFQSAKMTSPVCLHHNQLQLLPSQLLQCAG